jgi:hypothetical protein
MDNNQTTKRMFNTRPEGKKRNGRPKLWLGDSVDQDIKLLGERNWKNFALNRGEWRKLFEEGQGPRRAVEPVIMMMMSLLYRTFFCHQLLLVYAYAPLPLIPCTI